MRSTAASVVAYIEEQPPGWQPTLRKLRAACRRQLRGYAERMVCGMPSYERLGLVVVSFGKHGALPFALHLETARIRCTRWRTCRPEPGQGLHTVPAARTGRLGRRIQPVLRRYLHEHRHYLLTWSWRWCVPGQHVPKSVPQKSQEFAPLAG